MLANLDKLKIMLTKISRLFSVIGISETWLNDHTSDQVNITGYNFISNHRTSKIGGGIGLYLLHHFEYKFDTLDQEILFNKLEHYGICGMALQWIKSYLSNCKQFVQFRKTCSDEEVIKCGVPQGSVLGPLLFILYINDLPNVSKVTESLLFADDTSIFYSHSNAIQLFSILNEELQKVDAWI